MKVFEMVLDAVQYLSEGVARLFSPADDEYPNVGFQPFEGEPLSEGVDQRS